MASLGGAVAYSRMSTQLRQLFHSQCGATKEDISPVTENRSIPQGEDLSYEAWAAFRKQQKQNKGPQITPAPPPKIRGKGPIHEKGRRRRMDSIGVQGNATGAIAVGASITFYPNVRSNKNRRPPLQYGVHLRIQDRPFLPLRWRTPRLNKNRRNIPLPPL